MPHFTDAYADKMLQLLRAGHPVERCFKQEIFTVPDLLTAVVVTFDDVREDQRVIRDGVTYETFIERMAKVKPGWLEFDRENFDMLAASPEKTFHGAEGRAHYVMKGGQHADRWTIETANEDMLLAATGIWIGWGPLVQEDLRLLRERIPVGREHFAEFERVVRITFNFLFFRGEYLGEGRAQVRTAAENEGVEIRDIIFTNTANTGFWKDIKDKYGVSEVVVDAKNTDDVTRDDLRQLYCYLKPAVGLWGFLVCRAAPSEPIQAFNRTLFKNFAQERGVTILCEDDLRQMVEIALRGRDASEYLQARKADFVRSI